ncbi:hypothetical protein [Myceligenerans xiligouense]|uniref:hypothetical protein n=1 Tax=Myceligenerans xiligouense TaxID=253184 RepID=UPI000F50B00C|nr:hypothetical protein [Myceligenerans xiligouense]
MLLASGSLPTAVADLPDGCQEIVNPDGSVEVICDEPGGPGGGGDPGGDNGGTGRTCEFKGDEIECTSDYGSWDGRCYVRVADPQPPKDSSYWEGNEDGVIIECTPYTCIDVVDVNSCQGHSYQWAPNPPSAPQASPEELARRAVAAMNLTMGDIGSTPPASANENAMGQLGLPIWLWVANREDRNAVGPIERTASDGGLSVLARGELDRTDWVISRNGQALATVTCRGADAAGTPYDGRDSTLPSPTCGFPADFNVHTGDLTVTATAHWTVTWEGGDQSGTINVTPPPTDTAIRIGETQTILN